MVCVPPHRTGQEERRIEETRCDTIVKSADRNILGLLEFPRATILGGTSLMRPGGAGPVILPKLGARTGMVAPHSCCSRSKTSFERR